MYIVQMTINQNVVFKLVLRCLIHTFLSLNKKNKNFNTHTSESKTFCNLLTPLQIGIEYCTLCNK
jgi:hypothetical protein